MSTNELVNLRLACCMQVLEFVHRLELDDIQPVWQDTIRFTLQQMLAFICCDMRHGCEHIGTMCSGAFDAIAMVDTAFAGLVVDIEILEIVVEVDGTCAEVSAEKSGVGREYGGDVDVSLPAERNCQPRLPLMEVRDDGLVEIVGDELKIRHK